MLPLLMIIQTTTKLALAFLLGWPARLPPPDPAACGYDAFEPNDDRSHAHRLAGVLADGRLCAGDTDWYSVHLDRGERVRVGVLHDREALTDPPTVFPPRQRRAVGLAYQAEGEVGTQLTASVEGWYRIRVMSRSDEGLDYVLLVWPASLEP